MRSKCLAIGVGTVRKVAAAGGDGSVFPYLDGAIAAAQTIGQWAINSGMAPDDVLVLTDDGGGSVVEADLSAAIDKLLPAGQRVDHLILFFAGHGLTGDTDDVSYWLLSDSLEAGYKIFVEALRRRLYFYDIGYISIFSDACREIAGKADIRGLEPHAGVSKRPSATDPQPEFARFNACQDTGSGYMVKKRGSAARGKCVFSGVLAEALWGRIADAIDQDEIDAQSLGLGLRKAVKARAESYGLDLVPTGNAGFARIVYFQGAHPPAPPDPDLAPWPPPDGPAIPVGAAPAAAVEAGAAGGADILEAGFAGSDGAAAAADGAERPWVGPYKIDLEAVEFETPSRGFEGRSAEWVEPVEETAPDPAFGVVAARNARRKRRAAKVRSELRSAPGATDRIAIGGKVAAIWSAKPAAWRAEGRARAVLEPCGDNLVMIEFADGLFAPLTCYRELGCTVVRDASGVIALNYVSRYADPRGGGAQVAGEALAQLQSRNLVAAEADALAIKLRDGKHSNPVLGAIAAYCYDLIGDMESIRRMAGFYRIHRQPVPYDIALLGMLESAAGSAQVPAVPRDRRRDPGSVPAWVVEAVRPGKVAVAGRCPWLRQGWDYVVSSEPGEEWLTAGLQGLAPHLQRSAFTTFDTAGGQRLAGIWGLTRYG